MEKKRSSKALAEKKKSKLRLIRRFLLIVVTMVMTFMLVAAVGIFVYGITRDDTKVTEKDKKSSPADRGEHENSPEITEEKEQIKEITNVAVFGVDDEELHTDVVFVVSFNSETKDINILSVPRDTKVTMCDDVVNGLVSRNREDFIPTRNGYGVCKFTEVHAYAGSGYRNDYSVLQLEDLLGIDIDYYVKFTTDGFISAVDAVGGVDFYVPMDMYWDMRDNGGPLINLKEGMQHLDGEQSEQLVRFRKGYGSQDLKRIEVQQDFMRTLAKKLMNMDNIKENIIPLTKTFFNCVETNATIMDALKYVKYIDDINVDNIRMETIPGEGGSVFFEHDSEGTQKLVLEMVYGEAQETGENENGSLQDNYSDDSGETENL